MIQGIRSWGRAAVAVLTVSLATICGCGSEPTAPAGGDKPAATAAPARPETPAAPATPTAPPTAAKPEPAPAPMTPAAEQPTPEQPEAELPAYIPVVEFRINRAAETLTGLKAYMDRSVPMVAALAMGEVYPVLVHTNNLDGIDGKKPIRLVMYAPRKALQEMKGAQKPAEPEVEPGLVNENGEAAEEGEEAEAEASSEPLYAEFVPVSKEAEYLDKLGEEIDEIEKDGEYRKFAMKNFAQEVYFKFAGGHAVFSNTKAGVDWGVLQVGSLAAADAGLAGEPSAVIEIRPHDLFRYLGLNKADKRKLVLDGMVAGFVETMERTAENLPPGVTLTAHADEVRKLFEICLDAGDQTEAVQLHLNVDKDAAALGFNVKAVKGSALAGKINGMKAIEPALLRRLPDTTALLVGAGASDPMVTELYRKVAKFLPEKEQGEMQAVVDLMAQIEGQPISAYFGFNANGHLAFVYELQVKPEGDVGALVKRVLAFQKNSFGQLNENPMLEPLLVLGQEKSVDGWTVYDNVLTQKAKNDDGEEVLEAYGKLLPNPMHVVIMVKERKLIAVAGPDFDNAFAAGKAYATAQGNLDLKPGFADWLKQDMTQRRAVFYGMLDGYTIVKRILAEETPNPKLPALAAQTVGTLNPVVFAVYAKADRLQAEIRVEAEAVKQWVAFAMQAKILMAGEEGGNDMPPVPEGGVEDGAEGGAGADF